MGAEGFKRKTFKIWTQCNKKVGLAGFDVVILMDSTLVVRASTMVPSIESSMCSFAFSNCLYPYHDIAI
jgi:hypothetical protein